MKIAVYAIALNEEQFVERWAWSAQEADEIYLIDTGSTDNTAELAKSLGCKVSQLTVKPWRFDEARNASLLMLSEDIDFCVVLDLDEILIPGWRQHLENISPEATRAKYNYVWSHNADGTPAVQFRADRIHRRHGYRWKHPVHEILVPTENELIVDTDLHIIHLPDHNKPRSQYLPLLQLAAQETPDDDRIAHYLAREHMFYGNYAEAAQQFKRHLSLPSATWDAERCQSMRLLAACEPHMKEAWLLRAVAEAPHSREAWVDLAFWCYQTSDWFGCVSASRRALDITSPTGSYLNEPHAWGSFIHDVYSVALWNVGLRSEALEQARLALSKNPDDQRLILNVETMSASL